MKNVLIFGIGGFVGQYLANEFHNHGYHVCGSDIVRGDALPSWMDFQQADLLCTDDVTQLIQQVQPDMVINLAAISSVGASWNMPQTTIQVNIVGALNIMEAVKTMDANIKIMFIGSSEEYQQIDGAIDENAPLNATNPYGVSKMAQEKLSDIYRQRYGMQIYYVRPFNHTGIGQKDTFVLPSFCKQVAEIEKSCKAGIIKVGNLAVARDFSDVRDVVRAYRMIIESDDCTSVYNVGSGKAYLLSDLLSFVASLSLQEIEIQVDADRYRPVENPVIQCDNRHIRETLGWEPQFDVHDTLKQMFLYYCNT